MRVPLSIRPRLRKQPKRSKRQGRRRFRDLSIEQLEDRRVLSLAAPGFSEQFQDLLHPPGGDAFVVPSDLAARSDGFSASAAGSALADGQAPFGATWQDPSEFMLGDVYVNVVLLESAGEADASTEDWTATQISEVKAEIAEGLTWWEDTVARYGSVHSLNFTTDFTYADSPVPTGYEPINRPQSDQGLWINDFLNSVGYNSPSSYFVDLDQFNHDQRSANNTDWATTIFVVNSANDADGRFSDGYFAYAYLGGPFLVMTSDNNGWGIGRMGQVTAHEMGHIFYALDEYPGSRSYNDRSGYYSTRNLNASDDNLDPASRVPSIMAEASLQDIAWANHVTSPSSAAMIGWQDTDSDGIFDALDVPLTLTATGAYNSTTGLYEFGGTSSVQTLDNLNPLGSGHDITINTVDRAQYRLDGGDWTTAETYGGEEAALDLALGPFAAGTHTIEIRTIDDETGVTSSTFSDTFTVSGTSGIVGSKWNDLDGDGVRDPGEPGLDGFTIELVDRGTGSVVATAETTSVDLNGDSAIDPETEQGLYSFTGVAPGDYLLREVLQPGWRQTFPAELSFAPGGEFATGKFPRSLAAADLDGDGDLDLAAANDLSHDVSILLNNGDASFAAAVSYAVGGNPNSVTAGDLDGDGDLDLAVANWSSDNVSVLLNNGDGSFAPATNFAVGSRPRYATAADLDGDGDLDLAVANQNSDNVSVLLNDGSGSFALAVNFEAGGFPQSVAAADLDGDGDFDLAVANRLSDNVSVLLNKGDGSFAAAVNFDAGDLPRSVTVGDFDGDGDVDLAVANLNSSDVSVLLNNGAASFAAAVNYAVGGNPDFVTAADLDRDGDLDLIVERVSILLNKGDGTFADAVNFVAGEDVSLTTGDLDGDGDLDLVVANSSSNTLSVLLSQLGTHTLTLAGGELVEGLDFGNRQLANTLAIDVGEHVLLPDTPGQVIPILVSGGADVQGVVFNFQLDDGYPDVPGSTGDGPNIANVDLVGTGTVFGSIANSGNNVIESRDQIWVVGTTTSDGVIVAKGILAYVTIDTTGWFGGDGLWQLKLADTFNGDTNFQTPDGQIVPIIINGLVTIDNLPVADPGGPYTVDEGGSIFLDGSRSSDPDAGDAIVLYEWDLDGDGIFGETGDSAARGDEIGISPMFSAVGLDGPDTWTVRLQVTDSHGGKSSFQPAEVQITNVAPVLASVSDQTIRRADPLDLQNAGVTFTDAGTMDVHSATVDWGDGSPMETVQVIEPGPGSPGEVLGIHFYERGGVYTATVTVEDDDTASDSVGFTVHVLAEVAARHVFYNNSAWDDNDPSAGPDDDYAMAPRTSILDPTDPTFPDGQPKELGKQALMPGGTATFANYTSYTRGLNGIMVDIDGLTGTPTAADLSFKVGNSSDLTSWPTAPAPQSITVRPGAGADRSDRITIIWADDDPYTPEREPGSISNQWLQVTVLATATTGLADDDVFYFGNAIGESGTAIAESNVDTNDEIGARNHPHSLFHAASIDDAYDYDRDKRVDTNDEILARNNSTSAFTRLQLTFVPDTAGGANEGSEDLDGQLPPSDSRSSMLLEGTSPNLLPVVAYASESEGENHESAPVSCAIIVGEHVLLPNMPNQVIPVEVRGDLDVQGVVVNIEVADGYSDRPGSSEDGPNIANVDLLAPNAVFGKVSNTGQNFIETRQQIWVVGTSAASGRSLADGLLANVTIDTTGLDEDDGPWELKLAGTINGDTNFQSPAGQIIPWIENGVIRIDLPSRWHNAAQPTDVNGDTFVSPIDVLLIINRLNTLGSGTLPPVPTDSAAEVQFVDTNNDGVLSPLDVLLVINEINASIGDSSQHADEGDARTTVAGLVPQQDTTRSHIASQNQAPSPALPTSSPAPDRPIPQRGSCQSSAAQTVRQSLWAADAEYLWLDSELEASLSDVAPDVLSVWSP